MRSLGAGLEDVADENEARARLIGAVREMEQQQRQYQEALAEQQQMLQYMAQQQQVPNSQQAQQPPPQTPAVASKWWAPPEFDASLLPQYRELDPATGEHRWKSSTPADYRTKAESYQAHLDQWQTSILTNPGRLEDMIRSVAEDVAKPLMTQQFESQQQQQQEQQYYQDFSSVNSWMFEQNPITRELRRDLQGQPLFSNEGHRVAEIVQELESSGMTGAPKLWSAAINIFRGEQHQQTATPPAQQRAERAHQAARPAPARPDPRAIAEQRRQEHLARGAGLIPDRSGTFAKANGSTPPPQNPEMTVAERLHDRLLTNNIFYR